MKPLGDGFIKLIKMIIAPIIFCTVVTGIAGMENMKAVGKTGVLALLYFEVVSTIALIIGLVVVNVVEPGAGMNVDVSTLDAKAVEQYAKAAEQQSVVDFLLNVIPTTVVDAFAKGDILQVLLFCAAVRLCAARASANVARPVFDFIDRLSHGAVPHRRHHHAAAPLGAFGAMAFTIGKYGLGTLLSLGKLMVCFYATCLLFIFVVLGTIARAHGFSILAIHQLHPRRIVHRARHLILGVGPAAHDVQDGSAGCAKSVVGLVIPTGYSFNLDGTSIYLTMAAVFIAQATNTPLTLLRPAHAARRAAADFQRRRGGDGQRLHRAGSDAFGGGTLPVTALALILGIDRFMSEARALTNLVGNGVATVVVAKWCNALDGRN